MIQRFFTVASLLSLLCVAQVYAADSSAKSKDSLTYDTFTRYLEKSRRTQKLPFMVNEWVRKIERQEYREAAHLWATVKKDLPEKFVSGARAAQVYLLWKLDLPQSFFNEYVKALSSKEFSSSEASQYLYKVLEGDLTNWLQRNSFVMTSSQKQVLLERNIKVLIPSIYERDMALSKDQFEKIIQIPTARFENVETYVLTLAQKQKNEEALTLLDEKAPEFLVNRDAHLKDRVHLLKARILFQDGNLREAVDEYNLVNSESNYYPVAIEERGWAYARLGTYDRLLGDLETLTKPIFKNYFGPEAFVLKAIADLKLCRYADVKKDFETFDETFRPWVEKFKKSSGHMEAPFTDDVLLEASARVENLKNELNSLKKNEQESLLAPLTAVGKQSHWKILQNDLQESIQLAAKNLERQNLRIWKDKALALKEAIKKLRFVKVEWMSQLGIQTAQAQGESDLLKKKVASNSSSDVEVYPFEGVTWPDELFKLQAVANTTCKVGVAR